MVGDNSGRPLDYYNLKLEKSVSANDVPHMFKAFVDYQLPFGKGKAFLSGGRLNNAVFGGWSVSTVLNYFSGTPLGFGGSAALSGGWNGAGNRANIAAGNLKASGFDKAAFQIVNTNLPTNTYLKVAVLGPAPLTLGNWLSVNRSATGGRRGLSARRNQTKESYGSSCAISVLIQTASVGGHQRPSPIPRWAGNQRGKYWLRWDALRLLTLCTRLFVTLWRRCRTYRRPMVERLRRVSRLSGAGIWLQPSASKGPFAEPGNAHALKFWARRTPPRRSSARPNRLCARRARSTLLGRTPATIWAACCTVRSGGSSQRLRG
jgi:hypothetical protein